MNRNTIDNILNFLEEKEGKEIPEAWLDSIEQLKLIKELETHPDGTQYIHNDNLVLINRNITKLPNDLYVDGDLNLWRCKQLTKLPDKLHVEGWLDIRECSQITELPDDLFVGGWLAFPYTNISEIPNNLYVHYDLYVYDTPLSRKYSSDEIREMITSKGGTIIGKIHRK
jgi:hypothetical protein